MDTTEDKTAEIAVKLHAQRERDERIERIATIVGLLTAGIILQAIGAPESLVGGAIGAAAALVRSNPTARATILASGAGAAMGALMGGWAPVLS